MRDDSQKDTISGQMAKMMFETKIDKQTNEFQVRITKGFGMVVLNESDVRWLEKVLIFGLPPEGRVTIKQALQEEWD